MSLQFEQLTQKLANNEIISFFPDTNNVILNFLDRTGNIKQTVGQYANQILPPMNYIPYPDFSQLLSNGQIIDIEQKIKPKNPSNTILNFVDKSGKLYSSEVQYDMINNTISPPKFISVQILNNIPHKYIIGRADEDRLNIVLLNDQIKMYAIYDGHSGKNVADYLKQHLPNKLAESLMDVDFNNQDLIKQIINKVYIDLDTEMYQLKLTAGSTANVVLHKDNKLYIINLADSRAIIFNSDGKLLLETVDHDGSNLREKTRVESLGGSIYNGRISGTLMVTRGFGDFLFKRKSTLGYDPQGWVSVIPDIYSFDITKEGENTLLIASDGLWAGKYESSQEVINMIMKLPQDDICDLIAKEAKRNYPTNDYYKDDVTVIMFKLIGRVH